MKSNGVDTWLQSDAYSGFDSELIPLDEEMGVGHLNAHRAYQQFLPGEWNQDSTQVPVVGWDYGRSNSVDDVEKYVFDQPLLGGSFISITLAFDRKVEFANDGGTANFYDINDEFAPYSDTLPPGDDQITDLDLYLLPKGATDFDIPIALSISSDSTIEHIFAQIPETGEYEFWVHMYDNEPGGFQFYGIAWWAVAELPMMQGDYNGDHIVDAQDYNVWRMKFGNSVAAGTGPDGNGNGVIDAADYVVWRNNLSAGSGSALSTAVPEPTAIGLTVLGLLLGVATSTRRRVA